MESVKMSFLQLQYCSVRTIHRWTDKGCEILDTWMTLEIALARPLGES